MYAIGDYSYRRLVCFEQAVVDAGGVFDLNSAFRPPAYQEHLREVWEPLRRERQLDTADEIQLLIAVAVELAVLVDESGAPTSIRVMRGAGFGFDEAAVSAARKWRFQPGMRDGKPVVTEYRMMLQFSLRD